jgi:hypothetical protein
MLMTVFMIIAAIFAGFGFIALGLSWLGHKLRVEEEREAGEHNRTFHATQAVGWPMAWAPSGLVRFSIASHASIWGVPSFRTSCEDATQ